MVHSSFLEHCGCCEMQLVCLTSFSMELESAIEDSDKSNALGCSLLPLVRLASLAKENLKSKVLGCYMPLVVLLVSWANTEDGFATWQFVYCATDAWMAHWVDSCSQLYFCCVLLHNPCRSIGWLPDLIELIKIVFSSFLYSFGGLKILFSDWPSKSGTAMKLIDFDLCQKSQPSTMDSVGWNRSAIHGKLLYLFQKRKRTKNYWQWKFLRVIIFREQSSWKQKAADEIKNA